jgi:hypothetical protein
MSGSQPLLVAARRRQQRLPPGPLFWSAARIRRLPRAYRTRLYTQRIRRRADCIASFAAKKISFHVLPSSLHSVADFRSSHQGTRTRAARGSAQHWLARAWISWVGRCNIDATCKRVRASMRMQIVKSHRAEGHACGVAVGTACVVRLARGREGRREGAGLQVVSLPAWAEHDRDAGLGLRELGNRVLPGALTAAAHYQ